MSSMPPGHPASLLDSLPAPLHNRQDADELHVAIFASAQAPWPADQPLCAELRRLAPLPCRVSVIHPAGAALPAAAPDCEHHRADAGDEALAALLARQEAVCLPHALLARYQAALAGLYVPALIVLPEGAQPPAAGLSIGDAGPAELAALLLLLATDPPTRRRALDAQEALAQGAASRLWRVEGLFDSSYSLAIVNRHLALALDEASHAEHGAGSPAAALYTYEQGADPRPAFASVEQPERVEALWRRGADARAPAVALRNAWPPVVRDMRGARRVLANYAWEETTFPPEHAADFNRVLDCITAVSTQTAELLHDAGVNVPVAVVGNGVDHIARVQPEPPPAELPAGRFRFLHVSSCFPRKGADVLLRAFGQAFRAADPVVLIIKTFPNPHNDVARQLEQLRAADPQFPDVRIYEEDWSAAQIAGLYRACDTLVAPSRAEGFGLPMAEAMLHELPVIVTGWGGHLDFCTPAHSWHIDYRLQPARTHLGQRHSLWAEPDVAHLAELLRRMPGLSEAERRARTAPARAHVLAHYTWSAVARRTRAALAAVNAQPGPLPEPRIGWLSTWGSRCGIAAYSAHLSAAFDEEHLHIYAPDNETLEHGDAPHVQRCWQLGSADLGAIARDAVRRKLDALVIQFHWAFASVPALARLIEQLADAGVAVVLDLHNTRSAPDEARGGDWLRALRRCRRVLVHGLDDVQRLADWGLQGNVILFPLAVYPVPLPGADALAALRRRHALEGRTVLASYGYLMPHKGLAQLVEALALLRRQQPALNLHLLMVNAFYSEAASAAELARLRQGIDALELGAHVTLETRYLPEAESLALLSLADLIVFPYQNTEESSSAAVRMAISARRPIAVTPLPIFADLQGCAALLPGREPAQLAAGLGALLQTLAQPGQRDSLTRPLDAYADAHDARRLGERLRGLIVGILRQLPGMA